MKKDIYKKFYVCYYVHEINKILVHEHNNNRYNEQTDQRRNKMVEFRDVCMAYKDKKVLTGINITVKDGEFFVLVGSSGCGKTTLLKSVNKLLPVISGSVSVNGKPVSEISTKELPKTVGYVVQEGGLFPHMTARQNVMLVMKAAGFDKRILEKRADEMLRMVNLDPEEFGNKYPSQMSGGQQQRVGVARAFASDPPIVLMDEPFSALDPVTRRTLQDEIRSLQKKTGKTVIFVTHDMDEAIKLADRICIIKDGHVLQCDTPEEILKNPSDSSVRDFIGENRLWEHPEFIRAGDIMSVKNRNEIVSCEGECINISSDVTLREIMDKSYFERSDILRVYDRDGRIAGVIDRNRMIEILGRQFGIKDDKKGEDEDALHDSRLLRNLRRQVG